MAIPKKGSRIIVVDGIPYRWNIRRRDEHDGSYGDDKSISVELAQKPTSTLLIFLFEYYRHPFSILPSHISTYIQAALREGWQPAKNGKFHLDAESLKPFLSQEQFLQTKRRWWFGFLPK